MAKQRKLPDELDGEGLYNAVDDGLFHIGRSSLKDALKTVFCKKCGNREFNVGSDYYFTAIRCPKCGWEVCIHDG